MAIAAFAVCVVVLSDADGVFAHEAGTGLQAVDEVFLAQVARKLSPVVYAVPGLYAHEGRVLGGGAPDAYCRRAEASGLMDLKLSGDISPCPIARHMESSTLSSIAFGHHSFQGRRSC